MEKPTANAVPNATEAVFLALRWLGGQELNKAGHDQASDLVTAGRVLWPTEQRSVRQISSDLRSEAVQLLSSLSLTEQDRAILRVLIGRQDIVADQSAEPPWSFRSARRARRIGELRTSLISGLGLHGCSLDDFRRRYENPALLVLAAALTGTRGSALRSDRSIGLSGQSSEGPKPVEDEKTTQALNLLGRQTVMDVLSRMFPPPTEVVFQALTPGMSGSSVFLVTPHHIGAQLRCVVKIGPANDIQAELRAWQEHVEPYIQNKYLPHIHTSVLLGDVGGIAYQFFAKTTLNQKLESLAAAGDLREIELLLSKLLALVDSAWNGDRQRNPRDLLKDDYPLMESDLVSFEKFCAATDVASRPASKDVALIRKLWVADPSPVPALQFMSRCHGDLYGDNVLLDGHDLCLIDFSHTKQQHYLRDFITLEGDLLPRLMPGDDARGIDTLHSTLRLIEVACPNTPEDFYLIPDPEEEGPETASAVAALRAIRQRAWRRMENEPEEISNYQVGVIRRLVRTVTRVENRLTNTQRRAGALLAVGHARRLAQTYSLISNPSPISPSDISLVASSSMRGPTVGVARAEQFAKKLRMARTLRVPLFSIIGGLYLDVALDPVETIELVPDEWSNLGPIELRLGGSCVQVGRAMHQSFNVQSLFYSAIGGSVDALSVEAKRLLTRETWIANCFYAEIPGVSTAVSVNLQQGARDFTSVFTHKGALEYLDWDRIWLDLLAEHQEGRVLYVAGFFRTRLFYQLDHHLQTMSQSQIVVMDHGRLVPEVESADVVQRLKTSFARGQVDVYICTLSELWALVKHPQRQSLPPVSKRSADLIAYLASQIDLPAVTVVRDHEWPGPTSAFLLFASDPQRVELVTLQTGDPLRSRGVGLDNGFNAGFLYNLARGAIDQDVSGAVRHATREGLREWMRASR